MVYTGILQCQRKSLQRVALFGRDISCFAHLVEHHITPSARTLLKTDRIEIRRIFTHTNQCGSFFYFQFFRITSEIGIRCSLDAYRIIQEVKFIEIHSQYLFFGVITLQFYSDHPFYRFLKQTFHHIIRTGRVKLFRQLLRNGTTATRIFLEQQTTLHNGAEQSDSINSGMLGKAYIFRCDQRIDNIGRQVIVTYINAIFLTKRIGTEHLPVFRENLCGKLIIRIFQVFNRRHITYPTFGYGEKNSGTSQYYDG